LEGESVGSDAKSAGLCRWIKAYPDAEEGLPFSASDWLLPRNLFALCKQAGVSDLSMGRWLAKAGAHWQAPSNLNYAGNLTQGYPSWSYKSRTNESKTIGLGMGQWTVLEWALFTCPEAALEACLHGARLATGTEDFLRSRADQSDSFRDRSVDYAKAHVWAEACRVAESSFKSSKGPAKRKSMSI
jgi:hypothetical protein